MKMRKALSFVLVLALVLGSFGMVFAAPAVQGTALSDIEGNANYDAIVANTDLGIITGYEDGTYKPSNAVNRAEFAAMITRMLNIPESALAGYSASSFTDMGSYSWAKGYVGFCQAKGIITGYGDGTFGPGNTITVNEAVTMVLRAVGYVSTSDELVGNWPSNYVTLAKRLGIYDDVTSTATIDRANAAQVIYNALTCEVVTVNANGDTSQAFAVYAENDTTGVKVLDHYKSVLEAYLDCTPTGKILYTDALADSSVVNTKAYVGAYVKAFLNSDDDVIAIAEVLSTFLTGDYNATKGEFKADGVTYKLATTGAVVSALEDAEYKTIKAGTVTTTQALLIENGVVSTTALTAAAFDTGLDDITLAVDVSGKNIKEIYSMNKWVAKEAFLYETDMLDTEDAKLNGYDFATNDDDNIDTNSFVLKGVDSLDKIAKDNLVTVYLTGESSGDIAKVTVGTKTVEGKITVVDGNDYTIAKTVYTTAAAAAWAEGSDTPALGDTGTAYLNYDGKFAYWDKEKGDTDNYAIVTGNYKDTGRDCTVVLFDKTGTETEYIVKDGANINTSDETTTVAIDIVSQPTEIVKYVSKGALVTFSLDKNGKIDELTVLTTTGTTPLMNKNRTILANTKIDSDVVVFVNDNGDYSIGKLADIESDTTISAVYYATKGAIDVIIVGSDYIGADSVYAVINSAKEAYNDDYDDDEKVLLVNGFVAGKEYTAYTDDESGFAAITAGAIVKLTVDSNGVITKATATTGHVIGITDSAPVTGYAIDKVDNYLISVSGAAVSNAETWFTIDPNAVVYEWDEDENEYSVAKLSDIKKKAGNFDGTKVALYQLDDDSAVVDLIIINPEDSIHK